MGFLAARHRRSDRPRRCLSSVCSAADARRGSADMPPRIYPPHRCLRPRDENPWGGGGDAPDVGRRAKRTRWDRFCLARLDLFPPAHRPFRASPHGAAHDVGRTKRTGLHRFCISRLHLFPPVTKPGAPAGPGHFPSRGRAHPTSGDGVRRSLLPARPPPAPPAPGSRPAPPPPAPHGRTRSAEAPPLALVREKGRGGVFGGGKGGGGVAFAFDHGQTRVWPAF